MSTYTPGPGAGAANISLDNISGANALNTDLNLNTHKVINVVDPTALQDAATKNYVDTQVSASGANVNLTNLVAPVQPNQNFDMQNTQTMINVPNPTNLTDVATKDYVDNFSPLVGASRQLDNLLVTSINQNLLPDLDNNKNLGSSALGWLSLFTTQVTGTNGAGGALTIQNAVGGTGSITIATNIIAGSTGQLSIRTGQSTGAASGQMTLFTGNSVSTSGSIIAQCGASSAGLGGAVTLSGGNGFTGTQSAIFRSGSITAGGSGQTGLVQIISGSNASVGAADNTGDIQIQTGAASGGNSGDVQLGSGSGVNAKGIVEIINSTVFKVGTLGADPIGADLSGGLQGGMLYFNNVTSKLRLYDGTSWVDLN